MQNKSVVNILHSVKPGWTSFRQEEKADADVMKERPDIVADVAITTPSAGHPASESPSTAVG